MIGRALATRVPAIVAALSFALLEALIASADPGRALEAFFFSPFSDPWRLASLAGAMAPLLVAGLGAGIAFRAGIFNLGGEGQAAAGFFVGTFFLSHAGTLPPVAAIVLAFVISALVGGIVAGLSALAERRLGASVLLTTFLFSQATLIVVDWAVSGPFRYPGSNLLGMAPIGPAFILPRLEGAFPLGLSFLLALFIAIVMIWLVRGTRRGFELGLFGRSREFARAQGLDPWLDTWPLALSGALSGVAGLLVSVGGSGQAVQGMTSGLGWNGLAVSLVAGTDPLLSIPSALIFAWLAEGAKSASIMSDLSPSTSAVIIALIVLLVTSEAGFRRPKKPAEATASVSKTGKA